MRETIVDGIFYPREGAELERLVLGLLEEAKERQEKAGPGKGDVSGAILPHAAYDFVGPLIAPVFNRIKKQNIEEVILLGQVHREEEECIFLPESSAFSSPLGTLDINTDAIEDFVSSGAIFRKSDKPHAEEHCLEVHLPFIKLLFPHAKIIPILLGTSRSSIVKELTRVFHYRFSSKEENKLFLISSNACAYKEGEKAQREAEALLDSIMEGDGKKLMEEYRNKTISPCAPAAISAYLEFISGDSSATLLLRSNSDTIKKNSKKIIEYASIIFEKSS